MNKNLLDLQKFSSIENLRTFHNHRFIRLAYRMILGREPEPAILENYCRTDNPRQELENIRNSDEAKDRYLNNTTQPLKKYEISAKLYPDGFDNLSERAKEIYIRLKR